MNKLWIIAKHTYRKNVKSWGFAILVLSPLLFMLIFGLIGYFVSRAEQGSVGQVAFIIEETAIQEALEGTPTENNLVFDMSLEEAQEALVDGELDRVAEVVVEADQVYVTYYEEPGADRLNFEAEEQALRDYQHLLTGQAFDLEAGFLNQLLNQQLAVETVELSQGGSGEIVFETSDDMGKVIKTGIAYIMVFLIFLFIVYYMQIVSQEIAKEKGTRVMEIVLSSMSASEHFYGKFLGIMLMILTHLAIYLVLAVGFFVLNAQFNWLDLSGATELLEVIDIGSILAGERGMIIWSSIFALAGIFMYFAMSAFFASLVTNTEDSQKVATPMMLLMIAGFYIGIFGMTSTNALFVKASSFLPFWTPFIMPFRMAAETVSPRELWISLGLSVLFVVLTFKFSTVFYRSNILSYSDKGVWDTIKRSYGLLKSERQAKD